MSVAVVLAAGIASVGAGWGSGLGEIRDTLSSLRTVQGRFIQVRATDILDKPIESRGRFYFRSPKDFRWEYLAPIRQVTITHGGTTSRHELRSGRFVSLRGRGRDTAREAMIGMASWFSGRFEGGGVFQASLTDKGGKVVELVPVDPDVKRAVESIKIYLGDEPGIIRRVVMKDTGGSTIEWRFEDVRINARIPDAVFLKPEMDGGRS